MLSLRASLSDVLWLPHAPASPCLVMLYSHTDASPSCPRSSADDPALPDLPSIEAAYSLAVNSTLDLVRQHYDMATPYGYQIVTYEGGPDGKGNGTAQDLAIAAHRQPWMRALVRRYYEGMRRIGVELLMHFTNVGTPSKYGRSRLSQRAFATLRTLPLTPPHARTVCVWPRYGNFGSIEAADQDPSTAPKQQGLFDFIDDHATCAIDEMRDAACAAPEACSGKGHCLAPNLRWGERDTSECSCYFANSGGDCSVFTPVVYQVRRGTRPRL